MGRRWQAQQALDQGRPPEEGPGLTEEVGCAGRGWGEDVNDRTGAQGNIQGGEESRGHKVAEAQGGWGTGVGVRTCRHKNQEPASPPWDVPPLTGQKDGRRGLRSRQQPGRPHSQTYVGPFSNLSFPMGG